MPSKFFGPVNGPGTDAAQHFVAKDYGDFLQVLRAFNCATKEFLCGSRFGDGPVFMIVPRLCLEMSVLAI
jgi:hypothetical protein